MSEKAGGVSVGEVSGRLVGRSDVKSPVQSREGLGNRAGVPRTPGIPTEARVPVPTLLDKAIRLRVGSFASRVPGIPEGVAFMGSRWGYPPNSTPACGSPCSPQDAHAPLPLASAVVLAPRHERCHPFPYHSPQPCGCPEFGGLPSSSRRIPARDRLQDFAAYFIRPPRSKGRQIEYPRSIPSRGEILTPGYRLQHTAALEERDRPV